MYKMRRTRQSAAARALLGVAAVIALGACATKGDVRSLQTELRDDLRALAARQDSLIARLQTEARSTQDTLRTQSDQLFDFRGEITRQLRDIGEALVTIEALVGQNQRGIASVRDQLVNLRRAPGIPPAGVADSTGTAAAEGIQGAEGDATQLYEAAVEQLRRESLSAAGMAFEQFLDLYPNHELAPRAMFFLGDVHEQQDRVDEALERFQEIRTLFPEAEVVPEALYRIARIQVDRDELDAARETLELIINTYPGVAVTTFARELLDQIR